MRSACGRLHLSAGHSPAHAGISRHAYRAAVIQLSEPAPRSIGTGLSGVAPRLRLSAGGTTPGAGTGGYYRGDHRRRHSPRLESLGVAVSAQPESLSYVRLSI